MMIASGDARNQIATRNGDCVCGTGAIRDSTAIQATSVATAVWDLGDDHRPMVRPATNQVMKFMPWSTSHSIESGLRGSLGAGYGALEKENQTNGLKTKNARKRITNVITCARMPASRPRQ
jgi:hypothetical protein